MVLNADPTLGLLCENDVDSLWQNSTKLLGSETKRQATSIGAAAVRRSVTEAGECSVDFT